LVDFNNYDTGTASSAITTKFTSAATTTASISRSSRTSST
jgi:hypothetical protein